MGKQVLGVLLLALGGDCSLSDHLGSSVATKLALRTLLSL